MNSNCRFTVFPAKRYICMLIQFKRLHLLYQQQQQEHYHITYSQHPNSIKLPASSACRRSVPLSLFSLILARHTGVHSHLWHGSTPF